MKHPLQPGSLSGVALRRTRRVDGVEVDLSLPRDAVRTLRTATTLTGLLQGRCRATRGPRGGSRRPGPLLHRRRVDRRTLAASDRRRPLSGDIAGVSPVLRDTDRVSPGIGSKMKKKPPTAIIPGNDARRPPHAAADPRRAEIPPPASAGTSRRRCARCARPGSTTGRCS